MNFKDYYLEKVKRQPDSDKRIFDRPDLPDNPQKMHIVGLCGTAMGTLAGLLKQKGFEVSGSDQACFPPISTMLEDLDIDMKIGNYQKENIGDADLVIVGNVARAHNPEATFARENNLPQATLPEVLTKYVFNEAKRLVVSGTHGKTTTTGLLAHIFEVAGKDPGFMIGGVPQHKDKSFNLGSGDFAIFEGDEYDTSYFDKAPKFLHYKPASAIITSVELDHLDIYDDFEDYKKAFKYFAESVPDDGFLIVADSYDVIDEVIKDSKATILKYGDKEGSDISFKNLRYQDGHQVFDFIYKGENLGEIKTPLSGEHNVYDILAATTMALQYGIDFSEIQKAIGTFNGMKRRQEIIAEVNGATIIDDFAHHPTAIKTTVDGISKKYENRRIISLFEPSTRSSRKKVFEDDYINSFDGSDIVFLKFPKEREGDDPAEFIDGNKIIEGLNDKEMDSYFFKNIDDLLEQLIPMIKPDDVVLVMSHGVFDGVREEIVKRLKSLS